MTKSFLAAGDFIFRERGGENKDRNKRWQGGIPGKALWFSFSARSDRFVEDHAVLVIRD